MNSEVAGFANVAALLFFIFLIAGTWIALRRRGRRRDDDCVPDGPADEPYRVYTRTYDVELAVSDVASSLPEISPDWDHGWYSDDHAMWLASIQGLKRVLEAQDESAWRTTEEKIAAALGDAPADDVVATILIDQSGSMKGLRMAWAATFAKRVTDMLSALGVRSEILGFSTAGWHGGYAYADWKNNKRPPRPGRLCALLHVIYKAADDAVLSEEACRAMMEPALLRENVDGEALEWAAARLTERPEPRKLLLVVSDGAPVDDATLMHNGPSYLWRHLEVVLEGLRSNRSLTLGGLGINHRVTALYPASAMIEGPADLPVAAGELLPAMIAASSESP